jgi:RNA polymerase sigma-70 factor (ECF subfamily)
MRTEALLRFGEALENLPPRRREVFELIRLRGLSYRDAAEVLDVSDRTVANHLRLAMKDLKDMLSDFPAESPADDDHGREERSSDG